MKLKNCRPETKYNSEDLVFNDDVKIEEFSEVDFNKKELPTNFTISTPNSISGGQLVTIKRKGSSKKLNSRSQRWKAVISRGTNNRLNWLY